MRCFIYSRKSVYTGKGESIENQIEMCRTYIASKLEVGAEITVYEDEGFSAKNTNRPRFQQMLRDMRQAAPDYVVCYRLDRISRSVSDFSALIEELNIRGISFVCIREEFDTSKPMGKAMMYVASVFAQLERETIAERVRDNLLLLARTGRWLGGTTPTGYTSERCREVVLDGRVKTSCQLKENPEELSVVDKLFGQFLSLHSISGVSKYLMRQGIRARGGQFYSLPGIKEILQNPVYCIADQEALAYFRSRKADVCFEEKECSEQLGLLAYNKRDYQKKNVPRQSIEKWIVAIGRHNGRIPGCDWVRVQEILADNIPTGKKPANMHNDYALLSGLLYCKQCGSRMFAKQRSGRERGQFDYLCGNKLRGGTFLCTCQNLSGPGTDALVCTHLSDYLVESKVIHDLLECQGKALRRQVRAGTLDGLEARKKRCDGEMAHLIDAISQGGLGEAAIRRLNGRMNELDAELEQMKFEEKELEHKLTLQESQETPSKLVAELSNLKEYFPQLTLQEKRTLIKRMTSCMIWDGENLSLYLV